MKHLFLVEMTVAALDTGAETVERFANGNGFTTSPADTPANTYYAPKVKQPAVLKRQLFGRNTTDGGTKIELGHLILHNPDGELDYLLDRAVDGREVRVLWGEHGDAYGDLEELLVATMEQVDAGDDVLTVRIRDRQTELDVPLQATKYAGDNVAPDGLEGTTELEGKPKPVCYGVVKNVPAVLVNGPKQVYQVNNGAVTSIDTVRDRGVKLGLSDFETVHSSGIWSRSVAAGPDRFVAVGDNYRIFYSLDGETWVDSSPGITGNSFWSVAYGGGLFVAAGEDGNLYTSPDGITWTARVSQFGTTRIWETAYGADGWMAVGAAGKISISTDGLTWTARTSLGGAVINNGVVYGNGMWVLCEDTGKAYTSTDFGVSWTARHAATGSGLKAVAWSGVLFVTVGVGGRVDTSVDGIVWETRTTGFTADLWFVRHVAGRFMAGGSTDFGTSVDGVRWYRQDNPFGAFAAEDGTAAQEKVVLVGGSSHIKAGLGAPAVTYATEADLLDDTQQPASGSFGVYLAGGLFRLGSTPDGEITADVTQADDTPAEMFEALLERAGMTSADWSAADVAALPTPTLGFWTGEETTIAAVLDRLAASIGRGGYWSVDHTGIFRIGELPELDVAVPVRSFVQNDVLKIARITTQDDSKGLPIHRSIVRFGRYYTVQTSDVAGSVPASVRAELAKEWREATAYDADVLALHPLSVQSRVETLLAERADARSAADDRLALRGTKRDPYELLVELNAENAAIDFGDVVTATHARYNLDAGKDFIVMGIAPNGEESSILLTVWG